MVGFAETKPSRPFLDSLYGSLQFFVLGGGADQHAANAYLQIARFLGPCVLGYAFVGAVVAMYGEQVNHFVIRHLRRHVVIAGLGAAGYRLARAFAADGWAVVAIESDPDNVAISGCRERGIRVMVGDATDHRLLRRTALDKAELLVALCGRAEVNIDVAAAARRGSAPGRSQVLTALAGFDDFDLWQVTKAPALVDRDQSAFRLELVNLWALAAELLLEEHPPFPAERPGSPHIVVVSDEGLADSLLIGVLRRWIGADRGPEDFLRLTLTGSSPKALADLALKNPELAEVPACRLALGGRQPTLSKPRPRARQPMRAPSMSPWRTRPRRSLRRSTSGTVWGGGSDAPSSSSSRTTTPAWPMLCAGEDRRCMAFTPSAGSAGPFAPALCSRVRPPRSSPASATCSTASTRRREGSPSRMTLPS